MKKLFLSILLVFVSVHLCFAMPVESSVRPGIFWIRKVRSDIVTTLILRVRWDIQEVEKEDMDGIPYTMFAYEEQEVRYQLPMGFDALEETGEIAFSICPIAWQGIVTVHLEENSEEFVQLTTEIAADDPHGGQVEIFYIELE